MAKQGTTHAYSDGSVFHGGCNAGSGWVLYAEGATQPLRSRSRRINETPRATTTLAEIYAATDALNDIARGHDVILHTDDQDLQRALRNTDTLRERIERHATARPVLGGAYTKLYNAVARHHSVTAVYSDADICPRMRMAHNLAREGAFASPPSAPSLPPRAVAMVPR